MRSPRAEEGGFCVPVRRLLLSSASSVFCFLTPRSSPCQHIFASTIPSLALPPTPRSPARSQQFSREITLPVSFNTVYSEVKRPISEKKNEKQKRGTVPVLELTTAIKLRGRCLAAVMTVVTLARRYAVCGRAICHKFLCNRSPLMLLHVHRARCARHPFPCRDMVSPSPSPPLPVLNVPRAPGCQKRRPWTSRSPHRQCVLSLSRPPGGRGGRGIWGQVSALGPVASRSR